MMAAHFVRVVRLFFRVKQDVHYLAGAFRNRCARSFRNRCARSEDGDNSCLSGTLVVSSDAFQVVDKHGGRVRLDDSCSQRVDEVAVGSVRVGPG